MEEQLNEIKRLCQEYIGTYNYDRSLLMHNSVVTLKAWYADALWIEKLVDECLQDLKR